MAVRKKKDAEMEMHTEENDALYQTGSENEENKGDGTEALHAVTENNALYQTDSENEDLDRLDTPSASEGEEKSGLYQTGSENGNTSQPDEPSSSEDGEKSGLHQTGLENNADPDGDALWADNNKQIPNQSGTEAVFDQSGTKDLLHPGRESSRNPHSARPGSRVLAIDEQLSVETESEKAKNDLLDLLESQKTGRILTGTIQGVERPENSQSISLAVIYHGDYKVVIPAKEAVVPPEDFRGQKPEDVMHYLITKRLGAEVDYIVKGVDAKEGVAVASRLEAMRAKRKEYYMGTDRDGNYRIYSGLNAEARVVSVIRSGIFVDLFGIETYIPLRELSYQRWMDAQVYFQPGQRILVRVLSVDRSSRNDIKVTASVKRASENPYEKALKRYSVGNRYVGTVSMVDTNGVFVALDGGVDCLCSYPKRGRPPRGSRVTVRILGINEDTNRIWGAITHIAAAR